MVEPSATLLSGQVWPGGPVRCGGAKSCRKIPVSLYQVEWYSIEYVPIILGLDCLLMSQHRPLCIPEYFAHYFPDRFLNPIFEGLIWAVSFDWAVGFHFGFGVAVQYQYITSPFYNSLMEAYWIGRKSCQQLRLSGLRASLLVFYCEMKHQAQILESSMGLCRISIILGFEMETLRSISGP